MKRTNPGGGLWTMGFGEVGATLKVLEDLCVTREHLARLRADPIYAERVAKFILQGGYEVQNIYEPTASQKQAREIMGKHFFGVKEWSMIYGVDFSQDQLLEVAKFPWGEDVLNASCPFVKGKSIRETHFAFLGLKTIKGKSLTINKWQELHPSSGQPHFFSHAPDNWWYTEKKFANELTCGFRWYLMPLEIVPNSVNKTYQEQVVILPAEYEVPFAIEEIIKDILFYKKNLIYLNPKSLGQCKDIIKDRKYSNNSVNYVSIGNFGSWGLGIFAYGSEHRDAFIGLAASRKF